jgi:ketoreductase RED1
MVASSPHRDVAVVAAGTIGVSWTALFLAHGARVRVYDPREDLDDFVREGLDRIAPTLDALGLPAERLDQRLEIARTLDDAVEGAAVIQENGPEKLELKRALLTSIEHAADPDALLLSSTSSLPATPLGAALSHPGRLLVGHPFNPPHLIPLVEVVPGERTDAASVAAAVDFYTAMGKHAVVIHHEIAGFVANRLQAAMFRECVHLVAQGVVDVGELDEIVTTSLGPRWAVDGPFRSFHLGGGDGGLNAFFAHLGPALEALWRDLGTPALDPATIELLTGQADRSFGGRSEADLERDRDRGQLAVLGALASVRDQPAISSNGRV